MHIALPKVTFTIDNLEKSNMLILKVISGSHAYGLNVPTSDVDHRGYYCVPQFYRDGLFSFNEQADDEKNDEVYFSLRRAFELLATANPNQIELLYMPQDCILLKTEPMDLLIQNRSLFITKQTYFSHAAYAVAQIQKAKGCNKRVNNPKPKDPPTIEDFCWFIPPWNLAHESMPMRPVLLKESGVDLTQYNCSSLEHVENTYRLYLYGKEAKGVFHGGQIVTQSIPFDDERSHYAGLLIYNENAYKKEFKEWQQYWEWMKKRNNARWVDQEKGNLDYDQKNMMHCLRLLNSCESILRNGEPIVRCTGELKTFLMQVRAGGFKYDYLMELVKEKELLLKELYESSTLPECPNYDKMGELFNGVTEMFDKSRWYA